MHVAVVGGSGMLGTYLTRSLRLEGHVVTSLSRRTQVRVDIRKTGELGLSLDQLQPDVVVHLAALTDIEECELHPEEAWVVNSLGPAQSAEWCTASRRKLIAVSTDAVFDGARGGYSERDEPLPQNVYATTKLLGESDVIAMGGLVVRSNFLGLSSGSLVDWMAKTLAADEIVHGYENVKFSPLYADDLAHAIVELIRLAPEGLLHLGGRDGITKLELAYAIRNQLGRGTVVAAQVPQSVVTRPLDTTLDSTQARSLLGDDWDRGWRQAVTEAVRGLGGEI